VARPQPPPWLPIQQAPDLAREAIDSAAKNLAAGNPRDALRAAGWAWHHQRYLREAYDMAGRAAKEAGETELSRAFFTITTQPHSAGAWLQAGWALVDQGASDLAIPLLEEAYRIEPNNIETRESLVIAYSDEGRHDDVVVLAAAMNLSERPSLAFPLAWSGLMTRRTETVERAMAILAKLAESAPEVRGVYAKAAAALERFRAFPPDDDIRHWHFIQYGGVTLDLTEDLDLAGGRYNLVSFTYEQVASVLLQLISVCEALEVPFGSLGFATRDGEVIARALGSLTGSKVVEGMPGEGWLIMGDPRDIEARRDEFNPNDPKVKTFALSFPWTTWGPRVVDATGLWTELAVLPWNGGWKGPEADGAVRERPVDRRSADELAADLVSAAGGVAANGHEVVGFALPRRSLLTVTQRGVPRGLPYVPDAPLPAASLNGMLD
jgi:hypothetical protein